VKNGHESLGRQNPWPVPHDVCVIFHTLHWFNKPVSVSCSFLKCMLGLSELSSLVWWSHVIHKIHIYASEGINNASSQHHYSMSGQSLPSGANRNDRAELETLCILCALFSTYLGTPGGIHVIREGIWYGVEYWSWYATRVITGRRDFRQLAA